MRSRSGPFREDSYYRIHVIPVFPTLPGTGRRTSSCSPTTSSKSMPSR